MDHSAYIDAAAATLGLSLTQEQRKGVALYFGLAASMAALVQGLPLTPADESGNVFVPVAPQGRRMNASSATAIAASVREGRATATDSVQQALQRIAATDGQVNAFTSVLAERAQKRAQWVDAHPRRERMKLAGVPFAVKNLFDIAALPTLAGSKIERDTAPAARDAVLVRRLEAEGAVLVGALNMDEYAYGFSTENTHYGATRNPHDLTRISGGSSGGSAAAVAAGQVPITLGSDTNGSIRVPASLCGTFGLKPTFGRLPRTGSYPFSASLDHLGPFARSVADLALAYDLMQGPDTQDPACAQRDIEPVSPLLERGAAGLRVAVLGGWFREMALAEALAAVDAVAQGAGHDAAGRTARGGARARRGLHRHRRRRRRAAPGRPEEARQRFRPDDARPLPRQRAGARRVGGAGAASAPLVRAARGAGLRDGGRADRAGHALHRTGHRHRVARDQRPAPAVARQHGAADAADLLHRPAGGDACRCGA